MVPTNCFQSSSVAAAIPLHIDTCSGCRKDCMSREFGPSDDDISLIDESASIGDDIKSSSPNSVQLSLPESFYDMMTLNGIPLAPGCKLGAEGQLLFTQFQAAKRTVDELQSQIKNQKRELKDFRVSFDECEPLKHIPRESLTLAQCVALCIYERINARESELEVRQRRADTTQAQADKCREEAEQEKQLFKRREMETCDTMKASERRELELEQKLREQQASLLRLKEQERLFDNLAAKNARAEEEVSKLRSIIDKHHNESGRVADAEKEFQNEIFDAKGKIQLLELDKLYLQKENGVICERAQKAEHDFKKSEAALCEAMKKSDNLSMQLTEAQQTAQFEYKSKAAEKEHRLREESKREIERIIETAKAASEREHRLLIDAKNEALSRLESTLSELEAQRNCFFDVKTNNTRMESEMKQTISEIRSELRIKSFEGERLFDANKKLEEDNVSLQLQKNMLREQIDAVQNEFRCLEKESTYEKKRFLEEISRKDEQLDMYTQAEFQIDSHIEEGRSPGVEGLLSNPKRRLQHSVALAQKCNALQLTIKQLHNELQQLKTNRDELLVKIQVADGLVRELKQPPSYIVEALKSKELALYRIRADNETLRMDLKNIQSERNSLKKKISCVLEKQQRIVDVKRVVNELKVRKKLEKENNEQQASLKPNNFVQLSSIATSDVEDMSVHLVHHGKTRFLQQTRQIHQNGTS